MCLALRFSDICILNTNLRIGPRASFPYRKQKKLQTISIFEADDENDDVTSNVTKHHKTNNARPALIHGRRNEVQILV